MKTFALILTLLLLAAAAHAGSICGTVRDAATGDPVANAGVFLRDEAGSYTGLHTATDETGAYCLDLVPIGSWTLEFLRDDYQVAYVTGIEVTDGPSGVDVELHDAVFSFAAPWPNPTQGEVWFRVGVGESVPVNLRVYDLAGRLVRSWSDTAPVTGDRSFSWNLRDETGRRVPAGVYLVRFTAAGTSLSRSVAIVR